MSAANPTISAHKQIYRAIQSLAASIASPNAIAAVTTAWRDLLRSPPPYATT